MANYVSPLTVLQPPSFCDPAYAGLLISSILYGVTCLQTFYYFRHYVDRWPIRMTVLVLWVLDSLHEILISVDLWMNCLRLQNGVPIEQLKNIARTTAAVLLVNTLVTACVNTFLLWRLWKLSGNKVYSGLILVLLIAHLALNLTPSMYLFIKPLGDPALGKKYLDDTSTSFYAESVTGLAVDCIIDILIATGLLYYLFKSKSGVVKSGGLVTKLMIMTVSNGLITSAFMIGELGSLIHPPRDAMGLFYFFSFVIGKMYINALLTSLNMRDRLQRSLNSRLGGSWSFSVRPNSPFVAGMAPETTLEITRSVPSSTRCNANISKINRPDALTVNGLGGCDKLRTSGIGVVSQSSGKNCDQAAAV